ncbi:MAG: indole-3-glycerol phosphate synthase TrpC [Planctomycetota bacterium]
MILDEIVQHKRVEVAALREQRPLAAVRADAGAAPAPRDFRRAISDRPDVALIAEIKRSSPSAGLIREDFDPALTADCYRAAGAAAMSVLTDERFFAGKLEYVAQAKAASSVPVLRKDFIIDEYQVHEASAAGADAILLIVRILSDRQLGEYLVLARELGMAALVETHTADEVGRALRSGADIIGVNNRDLDTLTIDLATTEHLARVIPSGRVIVSESGISSREDVERLAACGIHAILVGERLMKSADITDAARSLTGVSRAAG